MIAAALLHDIGHLLVSEDDHLAERGIDDRHEAIGAAFLARHFVTDVVAAVSLHVQAKRILCTIEPGYKESLVGGVDPESRGAGRAGQCRRGRRRSCARPRRPTRWRCGAGTTRPKSSASETPDLAHFRPYLDAARRP